MMLIIVHINSIEKTKVVVEKMKDLQYVTRKVTCAKQCVNFQTLSSL